MAAPLPVSWEFSLFGVKFTGVFHTVAGCEYLPSSGDVLVFASWAYACTPSLVGGCYKVSRNFFALGEAV